MDLLTHIIYFVIASVLALASWLAYLYLNNLLDKHMSQGVVMEILGIALSLLLIVAMSLIINTYSFSFASGLLLVAIGVGIYLPLKKFLRPESA